MKAQLIRHKRSNRFFNFFKRLGVIKYIFIVYILVILIASLLLYWPISHNKEYLTKNNLKVTYMNCFFLAASAFSDTGLTTMPIAFTFNMFGQAVVAIAILIGGLGVFTLKFYIFTTLFSFKLNIFNSEQIQSERGGGNNIGETKKIIKVSITFLLIALLAGFIIFSLIFYTSGDGLFNNKKYEFGPKWEDGMTLSQKIKPGEFNPYEIESQNPYKNFSLSFRYGVFHTISSLNNAGFDIIGSKSLQPYYKNYALQIFTMIYIFLGGIGYPVIYDVYSKIKSLDKRNPRHRFTLFTKLSLVTYLFVTTIGFLLVLTFSATSKIHNQFWNNQNYGTHGEKTWAIFFQTISTRSAGFATVDIYHFNHQSIIILGILMFIGFSPVSTAGGIRSITIGVIFLSIITMIIGKKRVTAFKREIGKETLYKAINILVIGCLIILIGTLILYSNANLNDALNGKTYDLTHAFFEICSAFGTSGLTVGLTAQTKVASKILLIIWMIIGQLGIQQTVLIWGRGKSRSEHYRRIYEDVAIG